MTENNKHKTPDNSEDDNSVTPNKATKDTITTEEESVTTELPSPKKDEKVKASEKGLVFVSLALSTVAVAACIYLYLQETQGSSNDEISKLSAQQHTLSEKLNTYSFSQSQLTELITQVKQLETSNQAYKKQIESAQETQSKQLLSFEAKINRQNNTTKEDWKLAEAEYLIRLANQRLLLESDSSGAVSLLTSADNILNQLKDPITFDTRKALAKDIQALDAASQLDLEGSYLKLAALYESVEELPQREPSKPNSTETPKEYETSHQTTSSQITTNIQSTLKSFWSALRSLIIIRNDHKPIKMLLPPAEYQELITGIKIQLDIAQVSLIKGESVIYQQALSRTIEAVTTHFDTQSRAVSSFLTNLTNMQQLNPAPILPKPRDSLVAMKELMTTWTSRENTIQSSEDSTVISEPTTNPATENENLALDSQAGEEA